MHLRREGRLRDALRRNGAAVVRVDLEGWHYVLLTGVEGDAVRLFDPYFRREPFDGIPAAMVTDRPESCNRIVSAALMDSTDTAPYAMGPVEGRDALLMFNTRTLLTEETTVEYMI